MKKTIALLLAAVMVLSLAACGGNSAPKDEPKSTETDAVTTEAPTTEAPTTEAVLSKDEMLAAAKPLTKDEIQKSIDNMAFGKSLIGNIYTFGGNVYSVEEDHVVATFYISTGDNSSYATSANVMTANLYLPIEELISLEAKQRLLFVGQLDDVSTHEEDFPGWGKEKVVDMVFKSAAITGDRFENTGKVFSPNGSYGKNAWNILPPGSNTAYVVHFRDDISSYKGKTITFSYRITKDGVVDAYIIE